MARKRLNPVVLGTMVVLGMTTWTMWADIMTYNKGVTSLVSVQSRGEGDPMAETKLVRRRLQEDVSLSVYMLLEQMPKTGHPPPRKDSPQGDDEEDEDEKEGTNEENKGDDKEEKEAARKEVEKVSKKIVNPHDFKYLIEPKGICDDKDLFIVVYIHSTAKKPHRRQTIRRTWANSTFHGDTKIKVFFMMGYNQNTQPIIDKESKQYGDIVQEDFIDDYKNLSYKGVGALKYIHNHCSHAKFVLKADDDAFLNIFSVIHHLKELTDTDQTSDIFLCRLMSGSPVLRKGKWKVEESEYSRKFFPDYCSGLVFVLSMDVAEKLYQASYYTRFVWVDDAYLTGMVAKKAGVQKQWLKKVWIFNHTLIEEKLSGPKWYTLLTGHMGPKYFLPLWDKLVKVATGKKYRIPKRRKDKIKPDNFFI